MDSLDGVRAPKDDFALGQNPRLWLNGRVPCQPKFKMLHARRKKRGGGGFRRLVFFILIAGAGCFFLRHGHPKKIPAAKVLSSKPQPKPVVVSRLWSVDFSSPS